MTTLATPESAPTSSRSRWARTSRSFVAAYAAPVSLVVIILIAWEASLRVFDVEPFLFPKPSDVVVALRENADDLVSNAGVTIVEILLGFAIAVVVAVLVALLLHVSPSARRAVFPLLVASQAIPLIVIAPILVILLGFGIGPKLAIVTLMCFFPIVVTTVDGLQSSDPTMRNMMRTLYGNRWDILRRVEIPNALPSFFTGARIGATYSAVGAIVGEWSGASAGLGFFIQQRAASLDTPAVFAAVVTVCVISFALIFAVSLAERAFVPWARRSRT